ncbi:hypothetical protein SUGI_0449630 [Cryptomeria japonica]|nr:hypothetical protein SUGI_0449630 [Cryptomeria japonica]
MDQQGNMDPSHSTNKDVGRDTSTEQMFEERERELHIDANNTKLGVAGTSGVVNVPVQILSVPHQSSGEHVVGGDQVEHDPGTQHQECDVLQSDDLEGVQHVEVEARQNDVAPSEDPPSLQCPHPRKG